MNLVCECRVMRDRDDDNYAQVIEMQLRHQSKQAGIGAAVVSTIENAEKAPKKIKSWMNSISELHSSKPPTEVIPEHPWGTRVAGATCPLGHATSRDAAVHARHAMLYMHSHPRMRPSPEGALLQTHARH